GMPSWRWPKPLPDMLDRLIKFFTSLRLTVVLLGFGLLLVFVGTLAQVHEGLYEAQTRYFKSWFIWRPTIADSPWPLLLPGGYCIGTLLLVNLLAAHIKRFRLSARDRKSTRLNSSHVSISYAVFCLKKKKI